MAVEAPGPAEPLADIAARLPAAQRVFQRHGLDFYCQGREALADACARRGIAVDTLVALLAAEPEAAQPSVDARALPLARLIEHVLERYHAAHREELPRLIEAARTVERVHADKEACPGGLSEQLRCLAEELELHMQKEEQVLFPLAFAGRGRTASMPVQAMEQEHRDTARLLQGLRRTAHDYAAPAEACATWRGLYAELERFELELMRHIHMENYTLFPRILMG